MEHEISSATAAGFSDPRSGLGPVRVIGKPALRVAAPRIDPDVEIPPSPLWVRFLVDMPGWLISSVAHLLLILALSFLFGPRPPAATPAIVVEASTALNQPPEQEPVILTEVEPVDVRQLTLETVVQAAEATPDVPLEVNLAQEASAAKVAINLSQHAHQVAPKGDLLMHVGVRAGEALSGRGERMRGQLVKMNGGTPGSERAVALALKWFAAHQRRDGSWSFSFAHSCKGECSQSGVMDLCSTGATALALLPYLGAGNTHDTGPYQEQVSRGLQFLVRAQDRASGSLVSGAGSMYSHGLATIALCEAYAMTKAPFLETPAQNAVLFITTAQDRRTGGWRYLPGQAGDTSALGWQIMALKSAHMGHLHVPSASITNATRFLNSVQSEKGATYGYTSRLARPGTTAVGLLSRMYLGWPKDHEALVKGVHLLARNGPADDEAHTKYHMYYNYYATQVMSQFGGDIWPAWNEVMREQLIQSQVKQGHMAGSWTVPTHERPGHDAEMGGRLYYTALATMILEIYYRYMPIYQEEASEDDFRL